MTEEWEIENLLEKTDKLKKNISKLQINIKLIEEDVRKGKTNLFNPYETRLREKKGILKGWQEKLKRCEKELVIFEKRYRKAA